MSDTGTNQESVLSNLSPNVKLGLFAGAGVVLALLLLTLFVFIPQGVKSQGNKMEAGLSAGYMDGANYLSNCVVKSQQAAGVATTNAQAFDKVIKDAVAGSVGGQHVDLNSAAGRNAFLPILVQAYPDLKGQTDLFNKVVNVVTGCQDDYRNKQSIVQDQVRDFNSWRTGSWKVRSFGGGNFPNDNLYINLPGLNVTGKAAYAKISAPIVENTTVGAYQTGVQQPVNLFPSATATQ